MSRHKSDIVRALSIGLPVSIILALFTAAFNLMVHDYVYFSFRDIFRFDLNFVTLTLLFILGSAILMATVLYLFRFVQPERFPGNDTGIITMVFFLFTSTVTSLLILSFFSRIVFPHFLLPPWLLIILSLFLVINCCGVSILLSILVHFLVRNFLGSLYPQPPLREMYLVIIPVIILLFFGVFLANDIRYSGQEASNGPEQVNMDSIEASQNPSMPVVEETKNDDR